MVRDSFVFDMYEFYVIELEEEGEVPVVRLSNSNLLESGNGMLTLYGGEDYERKGHYTDIWHLTVSVQNVSSGREDEFVAKVKYTKVNYENSEQNYQILSWRKGFTLHYLKSQDNPVMIGGTFGNHQESQILVVLPEKKCEDVEHFREGQCVACPIGSLFDKQSKECDWCNPSEFFH